MNALANLYVNMHVQELLAEAARERVRRAAQPSRSTRIASALSSFRETIGRKPAIAA
jgi:hypothetical protein